MLYAQWLPSIAPPVLQGPRAQAFLVACGQAMDSHVAKTKQGILARVPLTQPPGQPVQLAPSDALPVLGLTRSMPRGPSETDASYAARLQQAFNAYAWSGTPTGLIEFALGPAGYDTVAIIINQQWAADTDDEIGNYGTGCGGTPPDENTDKWARFWVVLAGTDFADEGTWGDPGTWGDGGVWGSTASQAQVEQVAALINAWSPARDLCIGVFVVLPVDVAEQPYPNTSTQIDLPVPDTTWLEEWATFGGTGAPPAVPVGLAVTPVTGSGLSAGTYDYQVSALNAAGESAACSFVGNVVLSGTKNMHLTWTASEGATSYNVYGRTAGTRKLMANVTAATFTDDDTITPANPAAPASPSRTGFGTGATSSFWRFGSPIQHP